MRNFIIVILALFLSVQTKAQWTNNATYTTLTSSGNTVGIDAGASPSLGKLQIGTPGNSNQYKIVIPGNYNFEKVKLGQYNNGAAGLEFINHYNANASYGVRLFANIDQGGMGLQFQYAPTVNAEGSLSYSTGMSMRSTDGNIGIGTIATANDINNRLQIADGADDATDYSAVQITRPVNPSTNDNKFHLSFIRQGQMFSGIGYYKSGPTTGTNTLGIWNGSKTNTIPTIAFTQTGNVGIGTVSTGTYKLAVEGTMGARKVVVTQGAWADYVFDSAYELRPLMEVERFVKENKHLPDMPTTAEIEKSGIDVGDTQALLLKKIEELTLYLVEQKKEIDELKRKVGSLQINSLK